MGMLAKIRDVATMPVSLGAVTRAIGGIIGNVKTKAVSLISDGMEITNWGLGSINTSRNSRKWVQTYKSNSLMGSVVGRIADDVAKGQYRFYEMLGEADDGQMLLKLVHDNPFWDIWQTPNPDMSGYQYRKLGVEWLESSGLWFSWIERSGPAQVVNGQFILADPKHIWGVEPWNVIHRPSAARPYWKIRWQGQPKIIQPWDAIYIRYIDPEHPYRMEGMSPAARVADDIAGYEYASQWNLNLFRNGANPGKIVGMPTSKDNAEAFKTHYESEYKGNKNSHKTWFVGLGPDGKSQVQVIDLSRSHRDMEFGKGMDGCGNRVCQNWNMPPGVLGRGPLGPSDMHLYNEVCVDNRMFFIVDEYNRQLKNEFRGNQNHVLGYISPVRETKELEAQKANDGLTRGATTIDEYRKSRGEDPLPGGIGKGLLLPANTILVSSDATIEEVQKLLADRVGKTAPELPGHPTTPTSPGDSSFTPSSDVATSVSQGVRSGHVISVGGQAYGGRVVSKNGAVTK